MTELNFNSTQSPATANPHLAYAVRMVHAVCCLAGTSSFVADLRSSLRQLGMRRAVKEHDTPAIFEWLMEALSYQGISDAIAEDFIKQHGTVRWQEIANSLALRPPCPKLGGYPSVAFSRAAIRLPWQRQWNSRQLDDRINAAFFQFADLRLRYASNQAEVIVRSPLRLTTCSPAANIAMRLRFWIQIRA
jgi:hypothetical protein